MSATRYWFRGFIAGFLAVAASVLATPYVREFLHLVVLAGGSAVVVIGIAILVRLNAPRPGLTHGLIAGALTGVLFVMLVVAALFWIVLTNTT